MQGRCRASLAALLLLALAAAASTSAAAVAAQPAPAEEPPLVLPPAQTPAAVPPWAAMPSAHAPASQASPPQAAPSGPTAVPAPPLQAPAAQASPSQAATVVPAAQTPAAQAAAQLASVLRSQQLGNVAAAQAWDAGSLAADALGPAGVTLKVRVRRQRAQAWPCIRSETAFILSTCSLLAALQGVQGGLCQSGAPPVPVVELTIGQAHAAMLAGNLTCSQLVAAYLQRILAFDQPLQLNSIRALNPSAMEVRVMGHAPPGGEGRCCPRCMLGANAVLTTSTVMSQS